MAQKKTRSAKTVKRKPAPKRPAARKKSAARPAKRSGVKKSAPKKAATGKATSRKPAPKKAAPKKAAATKAAPKKAVATKAAPRQAAGQRPAPATKISAARPAPTTAVAAAVQAVKVAARPAEAKAVAGVARPAAPAAERPTVVKAHTLRPSAPAPAPAPAAPLDLPAVRSRLLAKKGEILALYRNDLRSGQESNDSPTEDIVDRANNAYSRELNFSISDAERARVLEIDEALARIESGAYGRCAHCGQPISGPRLQAVPWAKLCVQCQELLEQGLLPEA